MSFAPPYSRQQITEKNGDYLLALKGNQETFANDVELFFQDAEKQASEESQLDYHKSVDKDHGRVEIRECWATDDIDWLSMKDEWARLRSICMIKTQRIIGEETSNETFFYISSFEPMAELIGKVARKH